MSAVEAGYVLVVDDDHLTRSIIARGATELGHRVVTAVDGRDALDVMGREQVDIVLLDLLMPEMDGFQVLEAMRSDPDLGDLPVLVISGVDDTQSVVRAIQAGAIDVLPKPIERTMLEVRLNTALRHHRLRRLEHDYLAQELTLRQQEKLATLGRLSAGLAHELNNPAAAALRTARQLEQRLDHAHEVLVELSGRPEGQMAFEVEQSLAAIQPSEGTQSAVELADREDRLEDALAALGVDGLWELVPALAEIGLEPHDLRPHLDGLDATTATDVLRWRVARAAIRRGLTQLIGSIERMSGIVGALRSYSYMDRGERQAVDVRTGLDDTVTMLSHKMADGVTIERHYDPDLPLLQGMGGQLNQVWTNLLDNAIDAVAPDGTIVIRATGGDGEVVVEIEDDGCGIPDEMVGQVFDPFVTTKAPGQGTGLGLNISHQIVTEGHGGRIAVSCSPGSTVFTVGLPLSPPANPDTSPADETDGG